MVIDRIKESPAGSAERAFNYLWSRLVRHIAEQQHDRNLTAIQEGLRKGPKKPGMTAKPDPKPDPKKEATGTNVSGAVGKGKSKGKKGGKGKSSNDTSKGKGASNSSSQNPKDSKDACLHFLSEGTLPKGDWLSIQARETSFRQCGQTQRFSSNS